MFCHDDFHYGYQPRDFLVPPQDNDYGIKWPEGTDQLTKELVGYYRGGFLVNEKKTRPFDHMIAAIRLQWPDGTDGRRPSDHPIEFCKHGIINTGAMRVIWAFCNESDLGIAGCASSGKTRPIAACVIVDWQCAPNQTLTFVCTTTLSASEDRIYGAIVQLWNSSKFQPGTLLDYKKTIVFGGVDDSSASDREYNNAIKCLALELGVEGKKAVATTRGRKNRRVRLIIDELPEMGPFVLKARVNLQSNRDFKFVGIGNPNSHEDPHGELCKPDHPEGWDSINEFTPEWKTRTGRCIFMSGRWSPNFLVDENTPQDDLPFPYLTNKYMLEAMKTSCYGNTDSLEYMRNAVGFWPSSSTSQTVLTTKLIEAYGADAKVDWEGSPRKPLCGLDLGFTVGGDECVAQYGEIGAEFGGRKVLNHIATEVYQAKSDEIFEDSIARQVVLGCIQHGVEPACLGLDISSDGGKIAKAIIQFWSDSEELRMLGKIDTKAYELVAISSQGKPTDRLVSHVDPVSCAVRYDRRVTEYWFSIRQAVLSGVVRGVDTAARYVSDLCSRVYEQRKGEKIYLETKPEFKDRNEGRVSPDHGDAFSYLMEMARRHGLEFITASSWKERLAEERRRLMRTEARKRIDYSRVADYSSNSFGEHDC